MPLTAPPTTPLRSMAQADFDIAVAAELAWRSLNIQELNAFLANLVGDYTATSTTSTTVGTGTKVLTIQSGRSFQPGQTLVIARTSNPATQMIGTVSTYSGATLTMSIATIAGSGTYTDWSISLAPANAPAVAVDSRVLLQEVTASGASVVEISATLDTSYDHYVITFNGVTVSTNGVTLGLRYRQNGGTIPATAYDYNSNISTSATTVNTIATAISSSATSIVFASALSNTAGDSCNGEIHIYNATSSTLKKLTRIVGARHAASSASGLISACGGHTGTTALNGAQFVPSSGTVSGVFRLFGVKK